jgi:hypothetical protein
MKNFIKYWSYLIENENKEISFETYMLSEDKKTYLAKHNKDEDFNQEIFDKYWNEIRSRIKGKPEADIDKFWMNKPFKDLALFVNNFDNRNQSQRKEDSDKQEAISNGAHYLGDMKNSKGIEYEVWIPTTHESSVILRNKYKGGNDIGTSWCISVAGNPRYWKNYTDENKHNFIFLIKKNLVKSQSDYEIDDKIAIQIFPNFDKDIWDMDDESDNLDIDDYKSIIDFALDKGLNEKIFPNNYEFIIIGGKRIQIKNKENIDCSDKQLTSLKGSPLEVIGHFDCSYNQLTSLEYAPQEVGENFNCSYNKLTSLKNVPKKVGGSFYCHKNQLTSLKGSPQKVFGHFWCFNNELTSLEGAPQMVSGSFNCFDNQLTSLVGGPQKVGGDFTCFGNKLISLKGAPEIVRRRFICSDNQLTSLVGAPVEVNGDFDCFKNNLISLEGAPQIVSKGFTCFDNQLTSLIGAPEYVGVDFDCHNNQLSSLEGAPKEISGSFSCSGNEDLPEYKVDAYRTYLELSDSEKAPLTKDNHYYPTEEWENKFK